MGHSHLLNVTLYISFMTLILCRSHFYSCYNIKHLFYWSRELIIIILKAMEANLMRINLFLTRLFSFVHEASWEDQLQMLLIRRKVISLRWLRKPIMDHQITAVLLKKHHNLSYLFQQHLAEVKAKLKLLSLSGFFFLAITLWQLGNQDMLRITGLNVVNGKLWHVFCINILM